jgi:hypothetical protein
MNPNDKIRHQILEYFYERNTNATSKYGKKGSSVKISNAKKELKALYGLTQQQVMSNLTYLIDKGWINISNIEKTVQTKAGTIPSAVTWYEISASGIDKIDGESEFQESGKYAGININATGTNVITLGDGNVVNAQFEDLHAELSQLKHAVANSQLDDSQKLDISVDLENIKDQLAKANPDSTIIGHLWNRVKDVATVGGFTEALVKITPLISRLLPS